LPKAAHASFVRPERFRRRAADGARRERQVGPHGLRLLRERLTVGVAGDITACDLVGAPWRGETAGCHGFHEPAGSGFHLTGVTASGVPFSELTQPAAVSLNG